MKSRSLKRSVTLTFVAWIAVFQIAAFGLSAWWVVWPLLRTASNDFAALITLSAQTWVELPAARREALKTALQAEHGLQLADAAAPLERRTSYLPFVYLLQQKLGALTGHPAAVTWDETRQCYVADIEQDGVRLRFLFERKRIGTNPPLAVLVILGLSLALALLVAHRVSRRLTQPLTHLERAAQAVGRGETPALPAQNGVTELDGLSREFNQMAQQVRDQAHTRTTMLAGVSHDLRSPVTRLRMAVELARAHPAPALFDDMERYLEQMDRMIGDFIDYSRDISLRPPEPLDLAPWLARVAAEQQAECLACVTLTLLTDAPALERILVNLLGNARRYAPDSAPHLLCTQDGDSVHIDVLDRGPGIPQKSLEKVFDPFYRIDSARNSTGSGLGLAIVREICRAHAWKIELGNRPDGGLRARLSLPVSWSS
ncbi:MAG TPA: ATP-binding protein [Thiobacillus sp.]|nr:ATP-binding protein [Thiobacillus sp.]